MDTLTLSPYQSPEDSAGCSSEMTSHQTSLSEGAREVRPTRMAAEAAVRTLIRWAGDDPGRQGLRETPARVARAYGEWFSGYGQDPLSILERTFDETDGYDGPVTLRDVSLHSFCERHMAPIRGKAHIAYLPADRVVGISKLARVVEACARRLQTQERLTDDIASAVEAALRPRGVAVVIAAEHACMPSPAVCVHGTRMVTKSMRGAFRHDVDLQWEFLTSLEL